MHDLGQSRRIHHDASTMMIADQASDLIRARTAGACGDRRHPDKNFTLW
jgi:hypothetical protein